MIEEDRILSNYKSSFQVDFGMGKVDASLDGFVVTDWFGSGKYKFTERGTDIDLGKTKSSHSKGHFEGHDSEKKIP